MQWTFNNLNTIVIKKKCDVLKQEEVQGKMGEGKKNQDKI